MTRTDLAILFGLFWIWTGSIYMLGRLGARPDRPDFWLPGDLLPSEPEPVETVAEWERAKGFWR